MIIHNYINLIKPGIVIGNLMSSIGGFLMASNTHIHYYTLVNMSIGMSLIIASSCVFNNIIDRDIDSIMHRTRHRILAQNHFSIKNSIFYAIILNVSGFWFLTYTKTFLTILLAIIGVFTYVIVYSIWMKRKSIYSIIIGSISGSMPPVIGYCTVTHQFDIGACILLLIFSFWQISHSYAITIFRLNDYKAALIPTFTIKKGIALTRIHIIVCILCFALATALLTITGYTSTIFLYTMSILNIIWLSVGLFKYRLINDYFLWSKKMFFLSIIVITVLNLLLSLDAFLYKHDS